MLTAVAIRPLESDDLDEALRLSTSAGWNQRVDDWRLFLQIAPAGAFAAMADGPSTRSGPPRAQSRGGRIVGTAIGVDYGGFAWIAMMLVDPAYRGCGLGGRLLEAALESVPANLPVRLDATPLGRPLYARYGFEVETTLSRLVVDRAPAPPAWPEHRPEHSRGASPEHSRGARTDARAVRPMTTADLPLAIDRDREIFGGTRAPVLEWAFRSASGYAHVAGSPDAGYCFGRRGRLFDQIGPVVAGDAAVAHALVLEACAAANGRRVAVDAFDPSAVASAKAESHTAFTAGLRERGFVVERPFFRMSLRGRPAKHMTADIREYAIFGPEFG